MDYQQFSDIIFDLQQKDFELRNHLISTGKLGEGYNAEMAELHDSNASILEKIIDKIGFPIVEKLGPESAYSAWIIIQHSIGKPHFMKKCAELLAIEVQRKKADPRNLAYLTDRIAVFENKPQNYGTQFDWDEKGELTASPVDDIKKVNQRRKSLGLNTLQEQTEIIRNQAKAENHLPTEDFEKRKAEMEKWKRNVGWIT